MANFTFKPSAKNNTEAYNRVVWQFITVTPSKEFADGHQAIKDSYDMGFLTNGEFYGQTIALAMSLTETDMVIPSIEHTV